MESGTDVERYLHKFLCMRPEQLVYISVEICIRIKNEVTLGNNPRNCCTNEPVNCFMQLNENEEVLHKLYEVRYIHEFDVFGILSTFA